MRRTDREVKDMDRVQEILMSCKVCRLGMTDRSEERRVGKECAA